MRRTLLCIFTVLSLHSICGAHPDPAHSLAEINDHLKDTPDDIALHLAKADLLLRRGHPEQAEASIMRVLLLAPDQPEAVLLRIRLAHSLKNLPLALAHAKEITLRFPEYAAGWKWLARLHQENGNIDEAINTKTHHLSFKDSVDPVDYLTACSWLRERNAAGDHLLALGILDQGISHFGSIVAFQQAAIPLEISLSRFEEALARVSELVKKYGPSATHALLRAEIYEASGRYTEAAGACDSAIAILEAQLPSEDSPLNSLLIEIRARKQENLKKSDR